MEEEKCENRNEKYKWWWQIGVMIQKLTFSVWLDINKISGQFSVCDFQIFRNSNLERRWVIADAASPRSPWGFCCVLPPHKKSNPKHTLARFSSAGCLTRLTTMSSCLWVSKATSYKAIIMQNATLDHKLNKNL